MKEAFGDAWALSKGAVLAITTNGFIRKSSGRAVMGAGIAKQARDRYPGIDHLLGHMLEHGNNVYVLNEEEPALVSFPVKVFWWDPASLDLIERSARQLVEIVDSTWPDQMVYLPRPGCGNGGLRWAAVKPVLEPILDDRFVAIDRQS